MEHRKDEYIINKKVDRNTEGVIKLVVSFRNGGSGTTFSYNNRDARRWMEEAAIRVGDLVGGCKLQNTLSGKPNGTTLVGEWVFEAPTNNVKIAKKAPVVETKEADKSASFNAEFEGLNYDGDVAAKKTATTKKKRSTRKTKTRK